MKIIFLTDNFPPEVNAPATRTYEHAKEWIKNGAEVTIITCNPNFPQGKLYDGYKNGFRTVEDIEGIKVIRVWSYMSANQGFLKRTLDYVSFAVVASIVGVFEKADVIVATSPQFFTTWAGWVLSKLKRKPWVFELRDLWPESIATVGALNSDSKIFKFLENIELSLYRSANKVIPNTPAFKDNLIRRGINSDKLFVVPNGANMDLFKPREKNLELKSKLGISKDYVVGYVGTHGLAHSLDFIVESINKHAIDNCHFLFIGDGAVKKQIVEYSEENNLSNVTFLDPVSKDKIPEYLSIIDIALVPLKKSDTFKTVIPSKIFESGAMGIPILLGVEGQAQAIIEEYKAGLCFTPEDADSFSEKLEQLISDKTLYSELSKNGLNLAKAYDRKKLANEMLNELKNIKK
jgi:glycosyltransferase involved in cell wall biosynthesis